MIYRSFGIYMTLSSLILFELMDNPVHQIQEIWKVSGRLYNSEFNKLTCLTYNWWNRVSYCKVKKKTPCCQCCQGKEEEERYEDSTTIFLQSLQLSEDLLQQIVCQRISIYYTVGINTIIRFRRAIVSPIVLRGPPIYVLLQRYRFQMRSNASGWMVLKYWKVQPREQVLQGLSNQCISEIQTETWWRYRIMKTHNNTLPGTT